MGAILIFYEQEPMQQLINTQEFYKTIDLVITPLIVFTGQSNQQYHNKAFLKHIGYQVSDFPDFQGWFEKVYPDGAYRREVKQKWLRCRRNAQKNSESHFHLISRLFCSDQQYKWFDVHEDTIGDNRVVTFLDVNELQESNQELTEVLKQKDILLSIIAHDVRSPLSNIRQITQNFKEMDLSAAEISSVFSSLDTHIDYIFNIINSLLMRTSTEKGSFIEQAEAIDLAAFFRKYQAYYLERMEKLQVSFRFDLPEAETLRYDPFILDVICRNLIDNAIKYTPAGGYINISLDRKADHLEILISDTGMGMTPAQRERIFNNVGSRRFKDQITDSFGLGLVMAKQLLESHRGKLTVKSEPGTGTSFTVYIYETV